MLQPESYWTYKAPSIPELSDLPKGVFAGDERAWNSLSPGFRRTIWREATKCRQQEQSTLAADVERIARADAAHHKSEVQITAREAI